MQHQPDFNPYLPDPYTLVQAHRSCIYGPEKNPQATVGIVDWLWWTIGIPLKVSLALLTLVASGIYALAPILVILASAKYLGLFGGF